MKGRGSLGRAVKLARAAGLALLGVGLVSAGWFVLLPLLVRGFVRGIELLVLACVRLATSIAAGVSIWSVLRTVAAAAAAAIVTPIASIVLAALVLVVAVASYWLQRLLESKGESSR